MSVPMSNGHFSRNTILTSKDDTTRRAKTAFTTKARRGKSRPQLPAVTNSPAVIRAIPPNGKSAPVNALPTTVPPQASMATPTARMAQQAQDFGAVPKGSVGWLPGWLMKTSPEKEMGYAECFYLVQALGGGP
jgi:hypothetical protein